MGRKFGFLIIILLICATLLPPVLGWVVWRDLGHRMKMKISGRYTPAFFVPSFEIRNVHFEWDEKVKLLSGNVRVTYDPLSYVFKNAFRLRLSGENLSAKLLGEWAQMEGVQDATLKHFHADFLLGKKGLEEIYSL